MRHSARDAPLLVVPALHGEDSVDGTTFSFLLRQTLVLKEEEEEQFLEQSVQELRLLSERRLSVAARSSRRKLRDAASSSSSKRKRKNRRKKKTPRTSSSCGRAHRRQRQWYVHGWLRCFSAYAVSNSFVGRPTLLGIMDGSEGQYSSCARRRLRQWHMQGWFCWFFSRCFLFVVVRPKMLRIMAGMHQRDSYAVGWFCWYFSSHCIPSCGRQVPDACHHGGILCSCSSSTRLSPFSLSWRKGGEMFFARFTGIFRAPSIQTLSAREVSSTPSWLMSPYMANSCWLSRARGWRGRPESDSQAFCHLKKVACVMVNRQRLSMYTVTAPPPPPPPPLHPPNQLPNHHHLRNCGVTRVHFGAYWPNLSRRP